MMNTRFKEVWKEFARRNGELSFFAEAIREALTLASEAEHLRKENEELKANLEKAKDALRFYGDKSEYRIQIIDDVPVCKITDDEGQRARTTLEEI